MIQAVFQFQHSIPAHIIKGKVLFVITGREMATQIWQPILTYTGEVGCL